MRFEVKIETAPAMAAFREVRRDIKKDVRKVLFQVGTARGVPAARRIAPRILRPQIIVRATTTDVYFTSTGTGWRRARFWLLNRGGRIKKSFVASRPVPILLPNGQLVGFRMSVHRPRRIRGKRFLEKARDQVQPAIRVELERRIPKVIQAHLDRHDVFR